MPAIRKRLVLERLSPARLRALARHFELPPLRSPALKSLIEPLARSRRASLESILSQLKGAELRKLCKHHGLDHPGQTLNGLIGALLGRGPTYEEERMERVLGRLSKLSGPALDKAVEVGRVLSGELLGGVARGWDKDPWRTAAIRELSKDVRLPISESEVYRGAAIYEIVERRGSLPRGVSKGHLRAVMGLEPPTQDRLLERARRERLSARDVELLVREMRPGLARRARGDRRGKELLGLLEKIETNPPDDVRRLVQSVQARCRRILKRAERR